MNIAIAKFEAALLLRDRWLLSMLVAVAAAVLISSVSVAFDTVQTNAAKRNVAAAERARWVGQDEKDPHSAAHYSIYAFKPTPVLAVLDPGIEPFVGQAVWLEAHAQNDMLHRPKGEASPLERSGLLSPATLLVMLAPLVAFVLGFAAVARERDRGTLRLALGAALQPRFVLLSKALLNWLVMIALLLAPCALVALVLSVSQGALDADVALRGVAWVAAMSLYCALLILLGLGISALCTNSRLALVWLFGVWALLAIALPRSLSNVAESMMPLQSTQQVRARLQQEAPAYWSAEVSKERREELLAKYDARRVEDLPINERGAQLDIAERHSHAVFDRVLGAFYDRVEAQDALFARLSVLSPAAAVQHLSQQLAGTNFTHHRVFIQQAEAYRRDLVNRMNQEVMSHVVDEGDRYLAGRSLWESITPFDFQPLRIDAIGSRAASPLAVLAGWCVLALVVFVIAARRLRP